MAKKFTAQVDAIILKTDKRMMAVVRESTDRTIELAQLAGVSVTMPNGKRKDAPGGGKGGNMPVSTGFLRLSGQVSFTGMPTGPSRPPAGATEFPAPEPASTQLAGYKLGFTIFFGWTAVYARKMNAYYGFLDKAIARWPQTVAQVVEDVKRRIP